MSFFTFYTNESESTKVGYSRKLFSKIPWTNKTFDIATDTWSIRGNRLILNGRVYKIDPEVAAYILQVAGNRYTPAPCILLKGRRKALQLEALNLFSPHGCIPFSDLIVATDRPGSRTHFYCNCYRYIPRKNETTSDFSKSLRQKASEEGKIYTMLKWWKKPFKSFFLPDWIMLGSSKFFMEHEDPHTYEEIVYFDHSLKLTGKSIKFGGREFHAEYLMPATEMKTLHEIFVDKGSPIGSEGENYKSLPGLNPITWFKRDIIAICKDGIRYTRPDGLFGKKTSFIPYNEVYMTLITSHTLLLRKVNVFGSQNIESQRYFSITCGHAIKSALEEMCPQLQIGDGQSFGNFSWNPLSKRYRVIVTKEGVVFKNPHDKKKMVFLHKDDVSTVKSYFDMRLLCPFLFFRHVVIEGEPTNIRYDEDAMDNGHIKLHPKYSRLSKKLEEGTGTIKIGVPHMLFWKASALTNSAN